MAPFTKRRLGEFLHEIKGRLPTRGRRAGAVRCQLEEVRSGGLVRAWVQSLLNDLVVSRRDFIGITTTSVQNPFDFGDSLLDRVELRQCQASLTDADFAGDLEVQALVEPQEVSP